MAVHIECTNNSKNAKIVHEQGSLVFVIGSSLWDCIAHMRVYVCLLEAGHIYCKFYMNAFRSDGLVPSLLSVKGYCQNAVLV